METAELDVALEELELRLERLRALYEQYFMGLEKIEPQIARKDVDRRIYVLRREKIRNTAKRFKLQTIIQRYNTFQQYWQRICREIENGTYKRHLLKAQKNSGQLLTIAARKRLGRAARTSQAPEAAAPSQPPDTATPASAPPLVAPPAAPALAAAAPAPAAVPPPLRRPPPPTRGGDAAAALASPAAAAPVANPPSPPAVAKPTPPAKPAAAKFESLDLDMDFMGDWDPSATRGPAPKPAAPPARPAAPKPAPAVAAAPRTAPAPQAPPAPPKPVGAPPIAAPAVPKPAAAAPTARPASIPPAPVAVPPRPASSRPPTAPARPLGGLRTPPSPRIPPAVPPKPAPKPAPAPAAKPAPTPAAAAPKPAAASGGNVDDARLRDLHTRLQQAKQQTKEANVSYEGLAKSIRATEAKLREQHKNRRIDFDVVIKDGKAVVKPIVR